MYSLLQFSYDATVWFRQLIRSSFIVFLVVVVVFIIVINIINIFIIMLMCSIFESV